MSVLDALIQSPRLPQYFDHLRHVLDAERQRREEFYERVTEDQKAEFINGDMIVHSPVKLRHSEAASNLFTLLRLYVQHNNLGLVGYEKLLISLTRNDYEPDLCFFRAEVAARFAPDQMRFPAPDLVIEVLSPSTEANDRGVKFEDYAVHGVAEYWLIDPQSETLEQYLLDGDAFALQIKARTGTVSSAAVAGFEIPIRAIFDVAEHAATLQRLLAA